MFSSSNSTETTPLSNESEEEVSIIAWIGQIPKALKAVVSDSFYK
mgnify:CR=1 FL=1